MGKQQKRCLYCYNELDDDSAEMHKKCSKDFFGFEKPPELALNKENLQEWAKELTKRSVTIPGVQPKLSIHLQTESSNPKKARLTVVGLWGSFILKPRAERFPSLPENEDLTMHLAKMAGIKTASHTLIRTTSGELAYLTKRFDRIKDRKLPMEDFCQLLEVPSWGESKYRNGTMEKLGKALRSFSSVPGPDLIAFFDISVFSFLVGNADMHLKNFSILKSLENEYRLSPAYDLISSKLAMGNKDTEQVALHLNGKKSNLKRKDFMAFAQSLRIAGTIAEKTIEKYSALLNEFERFISISFLDNKMKEQYVEILNERRRLLEI